MRFTHPTVLDQRTIAGLAAFVLVQAVLVALAAASVVLFARRLVGRFDTPLPGRFLLGLGCISILAALAASKSRWRSISCGRLGSYGRRLMVPALLLIAVSLTVPGTNPWALGLLWLSAGVSVSLLTLPTSSLTIESLAPVFLGHSRKKLRRAATAPLANSAADQNVIVQQIQEQDADGAIIVRGSLNVRLQSSQRTAVAHVAFCPPFCGRPAVKVTLRDPDRRWADARIRVSQVVAHGARFELKLAEAAEFATRLMIDFEAIGRGQ